MADLTKFLQGGKCLRRGETMWKKIVKRGDYWFWVREMEDGRKEYQATKVIETQLMPSLDEGGYFSLDALMKMKGVTYRQSQRRQEPERRS